MTSIVEMLRSRYGSTSVLEYSEAKDEIQFQLPAPITDTQTASFRSHARALNELAVSHRLSVLIGRAKYVPGDFTFAISSVETFVQSIDVVGKYNVSLRFEVMARRRDTITALKSILLTEYGVESRKTITSFHVLPPSLATFIRRARQFADFAQVGIDRDKSDLSSVATNHFRYSPSEQDRMSDGMRVDHVPALVLIDIALFIDGMVQERASRWNISAEFLNYTDPRLAFDIFQKKEHGATEFVQNGQLVAVVRNWPPALSTNQAHQDAPEESPCT